MAAALQPLLQGGEEGTREFSLDYIWYALAYYMLVYCRFIISLAKGSSTRKLRNRKYVKYFSEVWYVG